MKVLQRLLKRDKIKGAEYDDTMGLLTKEDLQKLRDARTKPRSPHRKSTVMKWNCGACSGSYFYRVARCPTCESDKISETEQPTLYQYSEAVI